MSDTIAPGRELQIRIAHRMYECRRLLRSLMGDKYAEHIRGYMETAKARGMDDLSVLVQTLKRLTDAGCEYATMSFMAAFVELTEPDELTPKIEGTP